MDQKQALPRLRKEIGSIILLNERYNTPKTSLALFHFEPNDSQISISDRLEKCSLHEKKIDGKELYIFDSFFSDAEIENIRLYSRSSSFSRMSYASHESREQGEEPARSMNNQEKWLFFSNPPEIVKNLFAFFGFLGEKINADISLLPWDLADENITSSAVATNRLESASKESMQLGKHQDYNTEKLAFGIPILYEKGEKKHYPGSFVNGGENFPWLVSCMLYATEDTFVHDQYGLGTIFCDKNGEVATTVSAVNGRFVLFEGDILHSIEESHIPKEISSWRVSYVFKLILNPKEPHQNMKTSVYNFLKSYF